LLIGLGSQVEGASRSRLTADSPIHMYSSWYNGPEDLSWIADSYHRSMYRAAYDAGYALHLITWTHDPEVTFATAYGTACGRRYPVSATFIDDIKQVAAAFAGRAGDPPLYVTLDTEFQTYPCADNAWSVSPQATNYYRALKDSYVAAMKAIKTVAPNARVSIGWGGWQARWDDPSIGSGRSLVPYFADSMRASDFVSFQLMSGDSNVSDALAMTQLLGAYRPVLQAHHMPDGDTNTAAAVCSTWSADMKSTFTDENVARLVANGLFAWSILDDHCTVASEAQFAATRDIVRRYGR